MAAAPKDQTAGGPASAGTLAAASRLYRSARHGGRFAPDGVAGVPADWWLLCQSESGCILRRVHC